MSCAHCFCQSFAAAESGKWLWCWTKVAFFGQNTFVCAAFCSCLQVSFMEQSLMLSGRKIFTLFIKVLAVQKSCWSWLLLLIRRGTFPHSHCLNGCQGGIKWNFINNALTGLSLSMGRGRFCAGICTRASPLWWSKHFTAPQHCPHTRLTRGFPQAGGTWLHPIAPFFSQVSFSSNLVYWEIGSFSSFFMVRGQWQKCQLKTPQALGTVGFCVDLTFKSWVASIFTEGAEEEGKTMRGASQWRILCEGSWPSHTTNCGVHSYIHRSS